jgi:hypothetical protein
LIHPGIGTVRQQTGISRLVCDTADGCQSQIDGSGRVMALLEVDAIAENDVRLNARRGSEQY